MGMFDMFHTENEFVCPSCDKEFTVAHGIQSKKFECSLEMFRSGDMPLELNEHCQVVEDYERCPHCGKSVPVFFSFHRGIYVDTFGSYDTAECRSKSFEILETYRRINSERATAVDNINNIMHDLESVLDLYTKSPSQQRMSPLIILRNSEMFDFNIITTIRNILDKRR